MESTPIEALHNLTVVELVADGKGHLVIAWLREICLACAADDQQRRAAEKLRFVVDLPPAG
jgi:hypothetical protein